MGRRAPWWGGPLAQGASARGARIGTVEVVDLTALSDLDLANLGRSVADEQRRRAVEGGDLEALAEEAFAQAFAGGRVATPWMHEGLLVCPGRIVGTDPNHACVFCRVDDAWSWESGEHLYDRMRDAVHQGKPARQSITILAVADGSTVERVTCRCRSGQHRMTESTTYEVTREGLVLVATRRGGAVPDARH